VIRQQIREGARAGAVAAAATAGALIALGYAHGAALRPLNSVAHIVTGSRAYYMERFGGITVVALLVHTASVIVWGIALAALTRHLRGAMLYPVAIVFAAATWLFDLRIVPDQLKPGFESGLSGAEIGLVYLVLGVSLAWALGRERNEM
jgi:hypothetical protein